MDLDMILVLDDICTCSYSYYNGD